MLDSGLNFLRRWPVFHPWPATRAIKDSQHYDGIAFDSIGGDVAGVGDDEFPCSGVPASAAIQRESLQHADGFNDEVVYLNCGLWSVSSDEFENRFAIVERFWLPLEFHAAEPCSLSSKARRCSAIMASASSSPIRLAGSF